MKSRSKVWISSLSGSESVGLIGFVGFIGALCGALGFKSAEKSDEIRPFGDYEWWTTLGGVFGVLVGVVLCIVIAVLD